MNPFDNTVYHAINNLSWHSGILNDIMAFIAQYALEMYAVLLVIGWFTLPKSNFKQRNTLVASVVAAIVGLLINAIIAHVWYRPRPFVQLPAGSFHQVIPHAADASFPSDHTSGSFGLAAASWGSAQKWVQWSFTILAFLTMFARVYVGVHWPTDVLASLVVGVVSGRLVHRYSKFVEPITNIGLRLFRFGKYARR